MAKKQHTPRKLLYFVNKPNIMPGPQNVPNTFKVNFLRQKPTDFFFSLRNIKLGDHLKKNQLQFIEILFSKTTPQFKTSDKVLRNQKRIVMSTF